MDKKNSLVNLSKCYKNACMSELQALKPGNVHVFSDGHGMTIHDFVKSADVTADILVRMDLPLGERIYQAVEATKNAVGQNTNLGMLLLCAPLLEAAFYADATHTLDQRLSDMLMKTTISDADWVSKAIVLASPGGLGASKTHDVHQSPQVTLLEVMRYAQDYDRIASQYANFYQDVLEFGVARYHDAMIKWDNPAWSVTALYMSFLTRFVDTHVVRKHGQKIAENLCEEALEYETLYWQTDNPKLVQKSLLQWDMSLKMRGINPGTAADLTVATLLALLMHQCLPVTSECEISC